MSTCVFLFPSALSFSLLSIVGRVFVFVFSLCFAVEFFLNGLEAFFIY